MAYARAVATAISNCARITDGLFVPVDAVLLLDQTNAPVVVGLWDANGEIVTPAISNTISLHPAGSN
jgi:hypothetical protein